MPEQNKEYLPIKLIFPKQGTEKKIQGGGAPPKPFRKVTHEYRARLQNQVLQIEKTMPRTPRTQAIIPLQARLIRKAVAKSHRPERLFSSQSCPIIGAGTMGELFLKATPAGLSALRELIEQEGSEALDKELSTVETIEVVTPDFRRGRQSPRDILKNSPRRKGFVTRVRLFDFGGDEQIAASREFEARCRDQELEFSRAGYRRDSYVYAVNCKTEHDVQRLSTHSSVRSVAPMPLVHTIRPTMLNGRVLPEGLPQNADSDIPAVVVVDSGISSSNRALETWVVGRTSTVAPAYRNTAHGTFVAGLIAWGAELNPDLAGLEPGPCGVFDLQVLPNTDPDKGDVELLTEQEFLQALETALKDHANKFKVWNLSLSTNAVCSLDEFSPLAEQLDNLQEQYHVSFVISAGNFQTPPLLSYPRAGEHVNTGRITSPADSVLGITVGAVAHIDHPKGPAKGEPSPFSRHGAGPNHIIKPDLVHFGGTCALDLSDTRGVRSVSGNRSVEDLGTSFSAPLVSRNLARIYHEITPTPSRVLARALLTHHARDPRNGQRVPDGEENFLGFGRPAPPLECLACEPHTSTLVFDDALRPGFYLEWDDFPYPPSLFRDGRYFGEIWMTVAFDPSRGARWGSEYCETHVDAHFGVYNEVLNKSTGELREKFEGLVPPEHKNKGKLYEEFQVQELRKWAPVRTYHGILPKGGKAGLRWRLKLQLLVRHGTPDNFGPQPFSLIVSIADPEKKAPVYDEMAQIIRTRFKAENLVIRQSARVRTRM